MLIEDERSD